MGFFDDPYLNAGIASGFGRGRPGVGLLAGLQASDEARTNALRRGLLDQQMQQGLLTLDKAKREQELELQIAEAARGAYRTPEQAIGLSTGPMQDGSAMPTVQPGFDTQSFLGRLSQVAPLQALEWGQKLSKEDAPVVVAPGASLVSRKGQSLFTAPDKADKPPSSVQEYEYAKSQGFPGSYQQFQMELKKAGASNTNISVNTEKNLLNDIAGGVGKSIVGARDGAQAALSTIGTVGRLSEALDSGKVMAGPTSNFRQFGLQIGNVLGVSGKDATEKMVNTRQAIQSLAQLELDAAQQMKGQGQITEAERDIIRRAAAGDIEKMTVPELRTLAGTLDKTARSKIQGYNNQVKPLLSNPNAAPIAPFLSVQEPPARAAGGQGAVRRYNPATGRIE